MGAAADCDQDPLREALLAVTANATCTQCFGDDSGCHQQLIAELSFWHIESCPLSLPWAWQHKAWLHKHARAMLGAFAVVDC